jgi:uncharacterized protein YjbJ (UPF0337 family)
MTNETNSTVRDLTGRLKEGYGSVIGDNVTKTEGRADQAAAGMQARAGEAVDEASDVAEGIASRAGAAIRDAAGVVGEQAHNVGGKIYGAGAKANEVVGDTVAKAPLLSLLGMAAIGYLTAFLIHSTSSPLIEKSRAERWVRRW